MWSSDYYCALCAVGFREYKIAQPGADKSAKELDPGYDPRLVNKNDLEWLQHLVALGKYDKSPPDHQARCRYYLTGEGTCLDWGKCVVRRGEDPNVPAYLGAHSADDQIDLLLYLETVWSRLPAIPFHPQCYKIVLPKILSTKTNGRETSIDKELLHTVMVNHLINGDSSLIPRFVQLPMRFDYGIHNKEIFPPHVWKSLPGEEKYVSDPIHVMRVKRYCAQLPLIADKSPEISQSPIVRHINLNPTTDKFARLPTELIIEIFGHLSTREIVAFQSASAMASHANSNYFWRRHVQTEMPWLWEIPAGLLIKRGCWESIDWRQVCLDVQEMLEVNRPRDDEPCGTREQRQELGLVNRCRIWRTGEQIVQEYLGLLRRRNEAGGVTPPRVGGGGGGGGGSNP